MIDAPHLKTKTLSIADKKRAVKMQVHALVQLGLDIGAQSAESRSEAIVADNATGEATALFAYGHDLIRRLDGTANGPAVLVLWRRFAWTSLGSPKTKFRLSSSMILGSVAAVQVSRGLECGLSKGW